ncbi:MAG TPA: hypothetical protein VFQ58_03780, partial [Flavisolibacter sp.]|nr:hypothetical protein [Flavisolibacter sp.]
MKRKKIIREVLILTAWLAVIAGITTLLLAANSKQKKHFCNDVIIEIKESGDKLYIQKDDIAKQIGKFSDGSLKGKPVSVIHPEVIEKGLENNAWVRNAELFFDTKDVLHVVVEERQPIARVFTTEGSSFYIDSSA